MADRVDFYFRQRVTEAELDLAFSLLEKADRNLAADLGIFGIIAGAVPAPHSPVADLTVDLTAPTRAYDHLGQRIFFGTGQNVDCTVDLVGIPTEVATAGNERWLGVFLRFKRQLSDPRTDGNSQQVFFRRDESFELVVRQAPEGPAGLAPKPALQADELLVCDVRRRPGQTQILSMDLDLSRRQAFIFAQANAVAVQAGAWAILAPRGSTVQSALDEVDAELRDHFTGTARRHSASDVDYNPHGFLGAEDLQEALDELLDALTSTADRAPGASRVGADAAPGTPHSLSPGTVDLQLSQLLGFLNAHVGAVTEGHAASAISAAPHSYISGTNVQAQLQELVSDLASTTDGSAGAIRVGADAVSGTPHALAAGTVDAQLSQLLGFLNTHINAATGAHAASAISAAPHSYISGTTVQAQLQELVSDLAATTDGSAGAIRVGADAVSGTPHALTAGTVDAQLSQLLGFFNSHVGAATGAHAASAISATPHSYISGTTVQAQLQELVGDLAATSVGASGASRIGISDSGDNVNATDVEGALAELADAFEGDHFRGNEASAGQHRTIRQPALGTGRVLLWDARGTGGAGARLRVYADNDSIWFTLNAAWNGSAWARDSTSAFSGGFRFSRSEFELFHENTLAATFTAWTRTWRLPTGSTTNSALELSGSIQEVGRLGLEFSNSGSATNSIAGGGSVTFRNRFSTTPSSITLSPIATGGGFSGNPVVFFPDRDGFGFYSFQNVPALGTVYWFGTYTAIA